MVIGIVVNLSIDFLVRLIIIAERILHRLYVYIT